MKPSFRALSLGLASAVLSLGLSLSSVANDNFYAGKTINVISPSGTGGSIYLYNLLVANHIGRHIPGQPNAIADERLGGGGITAANYVDNIAPQDGTVIAGLHPSGLLAPRLSNTARAANYNPASFQWLGSLAARTYVDVLWHEVPVRTFNETLSREVTMLEGSILIGQGFYVSGNVPTERVAILQTAFERMLEDPAFIAEAERLNLLIEPISAAEVTRIAQDVFAIPDSVAENLDRIISQ